MFWNHLPPLMCDPPVVLVSAAVALSLASPVVPVARVVATRRWGLLGWGGSQANRGSNNPEQWNYFRVQ